MCACICVHVCTCVRAGASACAGGMPCSIFSLPSHLPLTPHLSPPLAPASVAAAKLAAELRLSQVQGGKVSMYAGSINLNSLSQVFEAADDNSSQATLNSTARGISPLRPKLVHQPVAAGSNGLGAGFASQVRTAVDFTLCSGGMFVVCM